MEPTTMFFNNREGTVALQIIALQLLYQRIKQDNKIRQEFILLCGEEGLSKLESSYEKINHNAVLVLGKYAMKINLTSEGKIILKDLTQKIPIMLEETMRIFSIAYSNIEKEQEDKFK